jgi:hypothetical protein
MDVTAERKLVDRVKRAATSMDIVKVCEIAERAPNRLRNAGSGLAKLRATDRPALRHLSYGFCRAHPIRSPFQDSRVHRWRWCVPFDPVSRRFRRKALRAAAPSKEHGR